MAKIAKFATFLPFFGISTGKFKENGPPKNGQNLTKIALFCTFLHFFATFLQKIPPFLTPLFSLNFPIEMTIFDPKKCQILTGSHKFHFFSKKWPFLTLFDPLFSLNFPVEMPKMAKLQICAKSEFRFPLLVLLYYI